MFAAIRVAVAVGGAVGSLARFWLAELFAALGMVAFPWATLVANVSGSLLIGLIAALTGPDGRLLVAPEVRLFWMVGHLRRLHHLLVLQPADADAGAGRRVGARRAEYRAFPGSVPRRRGAGLYDRRLAQPAAGGVTMQLPHDAMLLRIFFGERDRYGGRPLHDAIVQKARELQSGGGHRPARPDGLRPQFAHAPRQPARHLRGPADRGRDRRQRGQHRAFLPELEKMMGSGLVTLEKVKVIRYGDGQGT